MFTFIKDIATVFQGSNSISLPFQHHFMYWPLVFKKFQYIRVLNGQSRIFLYCTRTLISSPICEHMHDCVVDSATGTNTTGLYNVVYNILLSFYLITIQCYFCSMWNDVVIQFVRIFPCWVLNFTIMHSFTLVNVFSELK